LKLGQKVPIPSLSLADEFISNAVLTSEEPKSLEEQLFLHGSLFNSARVDARFPSCAMFN
jgi:hypothetical protein